MIYVALIACLLAGGAGGWGLTYLYFHKDKVRKQIAAEISGVAGKISGCC
jgi:hypothetical protein